MQLPTKESILEKIKYFIPYYLFSILLFMVTVSFIYTSKNHDFNVSFIDLIQNFFILLFLAPVSMTFGVINSLLFFANEITLLLVVCSWILFIIGYIKREIVMGKISITVSFYIPIIAGILDMDIII